MSNPVYEIYDEAYPVEEGVRFQIPLEPKKNHTVRNLFIALAVLVVAATILLFTIPHSTSHSANPTNDSGVAACRQMVANMNKSSDDDGKAMTMAEYNKAKTPFANSMYPDIRVAGTNLLDTIYKMDQLGDDADLGTAMTSMITIETQWGSLQTACLNHGVSVPSLPTS